MRKLELIAMIPVFFHTDETTELEKIEMPITADMYEVRECPFYDISAVTPIYDGDKQVECNIHCGGEVFKTPLLLDEVRNLIEQGRV